MKNFENVYHVQQKRKLTFRKERKLTITKKQKVKGLIYCHYVTAIMSDF